MSADGIILVVDDEPVIRMDLVDSLTGLGYRLVEAGSVAEALRILADEKGNITAIVTDVGLPDGRGDDLARKAREDYADMPIVITTGYGDSALRETLRADDGRTILLTKPYDPGQVVEALQRFGVSQSRTN